MFMNLDLRNSMLKLYTIKNDDKYSFNHPNHLTILVK